MPKVEFLTDYNPPCWKRGDTRDVAPHFARVLIDLGVAKLVKEPPRDKMISEAKKAKCHNIPGYTG
jgi:hypothetical protein